MALALSVAKDFSPLPAGRTRDDGLYSGEAFRDLLVASLKCETPLTVNMDGTMGYGSSWLEEAFGGLVSKVGITAEYLHANMKIESSDPSIVMEIWGYIDGNLFRSEV